MKKVLFALIPVSMLVFLSLQSNSSSSGLKFSQEHHFSADDLQPTATQKKVEELVAQILANYHYRRVPLNDSLSSKVFDAYIKELDGNKVFFLESDIKDLEKYRFEIDDQLQKGDLTAAYDIYNLYNKRSKERYKNVFTVLGKPFDFKVDESYAPNREKAAWAKDSKELDDYWRKDIKRQILDWKIGGKADTTAVRELTERFKRGEKYANRTKSEDVFQIYMNAFTESVDPHTSYMIPKVSAQFNQEMSQSLEGIGAVLTLENDYVTIKETMPGGPAFKSKQINPKDRIVGVAQGENGAFTDIVGWFTDDAVKLIRGPKGTTVRLKILAGNATTSDLPKEVKLVREKIKLEEQTAKKEILKVNKDGREVKLGLITIPMFYRDFEGARNNESDFKSTTADVKRFVNELKTEKVEGIVIDLRNNGGGSLVEAVNLTGLFITQGPVVQRRHPDGEIIQEFDKDPSQIYDGPLEILVNRFSASASEIFAAAIQDYKRGIVVGEQTYGKGTVQSVVELDRFLKGEPENVGQLKITMEKFYRITGSSTQHKGVTPDVELPSAFSAAEYGESSQPSALPWDMIASTKYSTYNDINDQILYKIRSKYQERIKTDLELKKLKEDFENWKRLKEKNSISLQEDKRKKEIDEQKKKSTQPETAVANSSGEILPDAKADDAKNDKHSKDTYLKESEKILLDLIASYPGSGIKVTQVEKK